MLREHTEKPVELQDTDMDAQRNFIELKQLRGLLNWRSLNLWQMVLQRVELNNCLYPEVRNLTCWLRLTQLIQHATGCSPWRPAVDTSTTWCEIYTLSPGFSRTSESSPNAAGTVTLSIAQDWAKIQQSKDRKTELLERWQRWDKVVTAQERKEIIQGRHDGKFTQDRSEHWNTEDQF